MIEAEKKEEAAAILDIIAKRAGVSHDDGTSICPLGFVDTGIMGEKKQHVKLELDANIGWNNGPYHIKGWVLYMKGSKGQASKLVNIFDIDDPLLFLMLMVRINLARTGGWEFPYYDEFKERITTLVENLSPSGKEVYNDEIEKAMQILADLPNHAKKKQLNRYPLQLIIEAV